MANLFSELHDFNTNIVIEEEAFTTAANEFDELSGKIDSLMKDINEMLNDLKTGFDTPAGHKFVKSCESTLLEPLKQQRIVVTHISENLKTAKTMYESVFNEYREVVNAMNTE